MTRKHLVLICFFVMAVLQLAVPGQLILRYESALRRGKPFRFRTEPVDPYDALRGRYVALRLQEDSVSAPDAEFHYGEKVFALVGQDRQGFGRFTGLSRTRPQNADYLRVKTGSWQGGGVVRLDLPFDRYYLREDLAPRAEQAYRDLSRGTASNVWVSVRILDGVGVVEGLYIHGLHIEEFLDKTADQGKR